MVFYLVSCDEEKQVVFLWDTLVLDLEGKQTSEVDSINPFTNYKLDVLFIKGNRKIKVPGYYAADGNAAETSAFSGNIWRVKFVPDEIGDWQYKISFTEKEGNSKEINTLNGREGSFSVVKGDFPDLDFRYHGRLSANTTSRYQQFQGSKKYFLKGGADSPENFLAFHEFDGTRDLDTANVFLHHYEAHIQDWKEGDPTWQDGKGKGIIGAINYLASKGMNAVYFLTMNIEGDGKDVWPYSSPTAFDRFDCSKLDQWEIVFDHAQKKGVLLHFVTQETENELMLDNGDVGPMRQLYYRELIARFGHHLAVTWNMGEENGPASFSPEGQSDEQRKAMFRYFKENDPYQNLVALHTHSTEEMRKHIIDPVLADPNLDALSMQIWQPENVNRDIKNWRASSVESGNPLVMYLDEIGPYWQGVKPDKDDMAHDTIRKQALWGALMAGGAGVEWYFGYKYAHADLGSEDWRARDIMWDQTRNAISFFHDHLPFWNMIPSDDLLLSGDGYLMTNNDSHLAVYLHDSLEKAIVDVSSFAQDNIKVQWYNPRKGGDLIDGETILINKKLYLSHNFGDKYTDWVCLVTFIVK